MRTSTVLIDESNVTEIPYFVFAMVMHLISYSQAKRAYQWHRNGIQESVVVNVVNCLTCQSKACKCLYTLPKQSTNTNSLYPISKHPLSRYSLSCVPLYSVQYTHIYMNTREQIQTQTARTIRLPNTIGFLFHAFSTMIHIRMLPWKCCWLHRVHRLPNGWRTIHIYIDHKKTIWNSRHTPTTSQ